MQEEASSSLCSFMEQGYPALDVSSISSGVFSTHLELISVPSFWHFFVADSSEFKAEPFLGGKVELTLAKEESPKDYNLVKQWSYQKSSVNIKRWLQATHSFCLNTNKQTNKQAPTISSKQNKM